MVWTSQKSPAQTGDEGGVGVGRQRAMKSFPCEEGRGLFIEKMANQAPQGRGLLPLQSGHHPSQEPLPHTQPGPETPPTPAVPGSVEPCGAPPPHPTPPRHRQIYDPGAPESRTAPRKAAGPPPSAKRVGPGDHSPTGLPSELRVQRNPQVPTGPGRQRLQEAAAGALLVSWL